MYPPPPVYSTLPDSCKWCTLLLLYTVHYLIAVNGVPSSSWSLISFKATTCFVRLLYPVFKDFLIILYKKHSDDKYINIRIVYISYQINKFIFIFYIFIKKNYRVISLPNKISYNYSKELSLCNKLRFSNTYIFSTFWCKPLIFQT